MIIESRRIVAMLLLFVAITGLAMSFGEDVLCGGELPGAHDVTFASVEHDTAQIHDAGCPCSPSQPDPHNDHFCTGDCGCPCQAPLSHSLTIVTNSNSFITHYHAEVTRHTPEVYLSLFVPPDSSTV